MFGLGKRHYKKDLNQYVEYSDFYVPKKNKQAFRQAIHETVETIMADEHYVDGLRYYEVLRLAGTIEDVASTMKKIDALICY
jgi:hypothetical protein